jgi:hypothetical protein
MSAAMPATVSAPGRTAMPVALGDGLAVEGPDSRIPGLAGGRRAHNNCRYRHHDEKHLFHG